MADEQFTLHRQLWRLYRRLPRLVRVWTVIIAFGALIELVLVSSGPSEAQRVRDAVAAAVREATGPDPAAVGRATRVAERRKVRSCRASWLDTGRTVRQSGRQEGGMRRALVSLTVAMAASGVSAASAQATFHLEMVNEVMLASSSGDTSSQFVEFIDNGGTEEAFTPVFAPYKLIVYDGAGNELGEQALNPTGLRSAAAADSEYLVSTPGVDSAFGVTGDERLTVRLPTAAGQVCFAGSEPAPQAVSCLTYGTITKPIPINSQGTGSRHGPVAPNGESDQLQPDGSVIAASPTPKAKNRSNSPSTPGAPRKPSLSRASLTGVARRKANLNLTAMSGAGEPGLKQLIINLPHGLSFRAGKLANGLKVSGANRIPLRFSARLLHGALELTLPTSSATVSIAARRGAISVARRLAKQVQRRRRTRLRLGATVTDAAGHTTELVVLISAS